jgi:hypothetical protein
MNKYDLHIHSCYSYESRSSPKLIIKKAKKQGLNGIAITDHNTIKGSLEAKRINKDKNFEIIPAAEIKTNKAEILVYYLQEEIKERDFFDVVDKIKEQDAIAVIAHPYTILRSRLKLQIKEVRNKIDGLECFNGRTLFNFENTVAEKYAEKFNLAKTGGSDSHNLFEIGSAYTMFDNSLKQAIKKRTTIVKGKINYSQVLRAYIIGTKYKLIVSKSIFLHKIFFE